MFVRAMHTERGVAAILKESSCYVFIEVNAGGKRVFAVAFTPKCSGKIEENLNRTGYRCYLRVPMRSGMYYTDKNCFMLSHSIDFLSPCATIIPLDKTT
jgi:hypothetical protein